MGFISFGGLYFCLGGLNPPQAHAWLRPCRLGSSLFLTFDILQSPVITISLFVFHLQLFAFTIGLGHMLCCSLVCLTFDARQLGILRSGHA